VKDSAQPLGWKPAHPEVHNCEDLVLPLIGDRGGEQMVLVADSTIGEIGGDGGAAEFAPRVC
jgi:hypothetical protein